MQTQGSHMWQPLSPAILGPTPHTRAALRKARTSPREVGERLRLEPSLVAACHRVHAFEGGLPVVAQVVGLQVLLHLAGTLLADVSNSLATMARSGPRSTPAGPCGPAVGRSTTAARPGRGAPTAWRSCRRPGRRGRSRHRARRRCGLQTGERQRRGGPTVVPGQTS
jgi:hypothetical protein